MSLLFVAFSSCFNPLIFTMKYFKVYAISSYRFVIIIIIIIILILNDQAFWKNTLEN